MKRLALLWLLLASTVHAAGLPAPPHIETMWHGRDGHVVRAFLARTVARADSAGATASQRLDAGEAAYWLGVQDALAGRADSARANWRRAVALRGDYDEGFALIDALGSRRRAAEWREARAIAGELAQQADLSVPRRVVESHARLAWTLSLLGRADSAAAELREHAPTLWRRPLWTRRAMRIQAAGGDLEAAWQSALVLAIRGRGQDREADSTLIVLTRRLGSSDDRRTTPLRNALARTLADEQSFAADLHGRIETLAAADGFPLQVLTFPARRDTVRGAALLLVLAPGDTIRSAEGLVRAAVNAGHAVALFAPRGCYGSVAPSAPGVDAWFMREAELTTRTVADANGVLDRLAKRPAFAGVRWVIGAVGDRADVALRLLESRHDVNAMLLVAPHVPLVAIADYRARLRTLGTPTFVQVAPEEPEALEFGDLLAHDTAPGQVRVADASGPGRGLRLLDTDARILPRLMGWLGERTAGSR